MYPQSMFLAKKKNIKKNELKIVIFTAVKITDDAAIRHVIVMMQTIELSIPE